MHAHANTKREGRVSDAVASSLSLLPQPTLPSQCFQFSRKRLSLILKMLNRFLVIDAVICFIFGAILFIAPAFTASLIFIQQTDGVHWHLLRCIGGQNIGASFIMYRMRNSSAETLTACYLIRVLGLTLTLIILSHCLAITPNLIYLEYLKIAKYWWFGWLVVNLFLQTASRWTVGETLVKENPVEGYMYQLDAFASLVIGATWLAFPKWLLHRQVSVHLDESHELCARLMGAYFLTSYVISNHALYWKEQRDRLVAVDSRALICVMILIAQVWSQYAYSEHWNGSHWVGILLLSSWGIFAIASRCYMKMQLIRKQEKTKLH